MFFANMIRVLRISVDVFSVKWNDLPRGTWPCNELDDDDSNKSFGHFGHGLV